ncbi:hypothetical protein CC2G_001383 [Coprinopsis cinerea AmutBmut pab1-1]|nr:hypothetical protein CC2G_001383 [Coprinopsis cinerea AmutBmut pab1-1]
MFRGGLRPRPYTSLEQQAPALFSNSTHAPPMYRRSNFFFGKPGSGPLLVERGNYDVGGDHLPFVTTFIPSAVNHHWLDLLFVWNVLNKTQSSTSRRLVLYLL